MKADRRITLITAIATFLMLSALTVLVWALTRSQGPPPSVPVTEASVLPAGHPPIEETATETFERITIEELKPLVDAGKVVLIDVRSAEQFVAGHIDKALHIPVASIEGEVQYLPKDKLIVTYCTCPAEESSGTAAAILQHSGLQARALKGGLDAWTSSGYPTAAGVK